ncbi:MAG: YncE family protein [Steroidobacteraceae bacterium]
MIVDTETKMIEPFASGDEVHAIVPVPGTDVIVTTNSGDASAKIISAEDGAILASIPTPKDPDGATFDPSTGDVVVVNGDVGQLTLISPKSRKIVGFVHVGGRLEFPAVDGRGRVYVNITNRNQVAVVNLATRKVIGRYPLPDCQGPTGLGYVQPDRLISVCFNGRLDILRAGTGKPIGSFRIGAFPDAVLIDPVHRLAFVPSAVSGKLAVIALQGSHNDSIVCSVHTQIGTRTGAINPATGEIWLPAARFKHYEQTLMRTGHHPPMLPGTFAVLELKVSPRTPD